MTEDLYAVLGLDRSASEDDVRRAYRRKSKTEHPDAGGTDERFQSVALAHRILTDKDKRAKFDRTGSVDDTPDQSLSQAMDLASQIMTSLFEREDAIHIDLVSAALTMIDNNIHQVTDALHKVKADSEKSKKLRARFTVKRGQNFIGQMLDHRLESIERAIDDGDKRLKVMRDARALVADAKFEPEPRPMSRNTAQTNWNATTAQGNWAGSIFGG